MNNEGWLLKERNENKINFNWFCWNEVNEASWLVVLFDEWWVMGRGRPWRSAEESEQRQESKPQSKVVKWSWRNEGNSLCGINGVDETKEWRQWRKQTERPTKLLSKKRGKPINTIPFLFSRCARWRNGVELNGREELKKYYNSK